MENPKSKHAVVVLSLNEETKKQFQAVNIHIPFRVGGVFPV